MAFANENKLDLNTLKKLLPKQPQLFAHVAAIYLQQGKFRTAEKLLVNGLKGDPDNTAGWIVKGELHLLQDDIEKSFDAFKAALTLDPHLPGVYEKLNHLLESVNDRNTQIEILKELRIMDPLDDLVQTMYQQAVMKRTALDNGLFSEDMIDEIAPGVMRKTLLQHNLLPDETERSRERDLTGKPLESRRMALDKEPTIKPESATQSAQLEKTGEESASAPSVDITTPEPAPATETSEDATINFDQFETADFSETETPASIEPQSAIDTPAEIDDTTEFGSESVDATDSDDMFDFSGIEPETATAMDPVTKHETVPEPEPVQAESHVAPAPTETIEKTEPEVISEVPEESDDSISGLGEKESESQIIDPESTINETTVFETPTEEDEETAIEEPDAPVKKSGGLKSAFGAWAEEVISKKVPDEDADSDEITETSADPEIKTVETPPADDIDWDLAKSWTDGVKVPPEKKPEITPQTKPDKPKEEPKGEGWDSVLQTTGDDEPKTESDAPKQPDALDPDWAPFENKDETQEDTGKSIDIPKPATESPKVINPDWSSLTESIEESPADEQSKEQPESTPAEVPGIDFGELEEEKPADESSPESEQIADLDIPKPAAEVPSALDPDWSPFGDQDEKKESDSSNLTSNDDTTEVIDPEPANESEKVPNLPGITGHSAADDMNESDQTSGYGVKKPELSSWLDDFTSEESIESETAAPSPSSTEQEDNAAAEARPEDIPSPASLDIPAPGTPDIAQTNEPAKSESDLSAWADNLLGEDAEGETTTPAEVKPDSSAWDFRENVQSDDQSATQLQDTDDEVVQGNEAPEVVHFPDIEQSPKSANDLASEEADISQGSAVDALRTPAGSEESEADEDNDKDKEEHDSPLMKLLRGEMTEHSTSKEVKFRSGSEQFPPPAELAADKLEGKKPTIVSQPEITGEEPVLPVGDSWSAVKAQAESELAEIAREVVPERPASAGADDIEPAIDPKPRPQKIATKTLAELYATQGDWDKAIEVYEQLLVKHPANDVYKERLQELKEKLANG